MTLPIELLLVLCLGIGAMLYASVGHGGASAYIAIMTLFAMAPAEIRPAALCLNIVVSGIAATQFIRAGHMSWRLLLPFAAAAVPLAFVGGMVSLPTHGYRPLLGVILLYATVSLVWSARKVSDEEPKRRLPLAAVLGMGGGIGLLSGLTGVGGGIFLSPLLLALRVAATRETSAVSSAFIFVNSIAGLTGFMLKGGSIPTHVPYWAIAVAVGGFVGATWGARYLRTPTLRYLLALVLLIAGLKMLGIG
jgi:uncharacterized membrane protein YfcA